MDLKRGSAPNPAKWPVALKQGVGDGVPIFIPPEALFSVFNPP